MARNKKNKFIEAAQKHLQKQNYDKAIKEYLKAHEADSKDVRVAQKLGELYIKTKKREEAVKFLRLAGSIYSRDGFHQRAIAVYRQVLDADPNNQEIRLEIAGLYRKLGLMAEATPHFKEALKHFEELGDKEKVIDIVRNLVELEPRSIGHRVKLAELYLKSGKRDQGYNEFKKAADELKNSGRWDDLAKLYEKLVKADPTNPDNLIGYGEALLQKGDQEKARESFKQVLKFKPDNLEVMDHLVNVCIRMQDIEGAVHYLKSAANIHEKNGDETSVAKCYQKILKVFPGDEQVRKKLQQLDVAPDKKVAESPKPASLPPRPVAEDEEGPIALEPAEEENIETVQDEGPPEPVPNPAASAPAPADEPPPVAESDIPTADQVPSLLTEADVYLRYGLHDKAAEYIRRVLAGFPEKHEAVRLQGMLAKEQGKLPEAVVSFQRAIQFAHREGDEEEARLYVEELLNIDPENPVARQYLEELNAGVEIDLDIDGDVDVGGDEEKISMSEGDEDISLHAADDDQLELVGDEEEEVFSFVDDGGDDQLQLVDDTVPETGHAPVSRPTDESALFELESDVETPSLDDVTPPLKDASEPSFMPTPEPEPLLEVEDEASVMEFEEAQVAEAPAPPPAPEPTMQIEDESPLMDIESAPVFEEIEEEEEEEVELEAIADTAFEELRKDTAASPASPPPRPRADTSGDVAEEEWAEVEPEIEAEIEPTLEVEPEIEAEVEPEMEPACEVEPEPVQVASAVEAQVDDEWAKAEPEIQPELEATGLDGAVEVETEPAHDFEDEWEDEFEEEVASEEVREEPRGLEPAVAAAPGNHIDAIADAADDAWGDAIVDDESEAPAAGLSVGDEFEDMGSVAEEVLGEVFGEDAQVGGEESDMFDLSSVLDDELTDEDLGVSDGEDLDATLSSFRERVKEEYGEDADTHFNLGIAYKEMGLYKDAIKSFQTAYKAGYTCGDCVAMIGLSLMDLGEYQKAEQIFREGLQNDELEEHAVLGLKFDLAQSIEKQDGRIREALETYQEIEASNPHFRDVRLVVERIKSSLGIVTESSEEPKVVSGASSRNKISYI